MDQYELAPQTVNMLTLTVLAVSLAGSLAKGHPVQLIPFGLHDGTIMHPLDVLDHYREKIERAPADLAARIRYASVLRALGWLARS